MTDAHIEPETITIERTIKLEIVPKEGQSLAEAAEEVSRLFMEYIRTPGHNFLKDYGATYEGVAEYLNTDPDERYFVAAQRGLPDAGYEGPWVIDTTVDVAAIAPQSKLSTDTAELPVITEAKPVAEPVDMNLPRTDYASWDETFFRTAYAFADRSKDPSTQVGAVVVGTKGPTQNRVLATGYNGAPIGWGDAVFPWSREGDSELKKKYYFVVHAEMNAVLSASRDGIGLLGAKVYVTHFPCFTCIKHLAQVGISEIIYDYAHNMPEDDAVAAAELVAKQTGIILTQREQSAKIRELAK